MTKKNRTHLARGRRTDVDGCNVNKVKCKTCPFNETSDGKYYNPDLVAKLMLTIISEKNHICHTTSTTICRGSRDYQLEIYYRLGVLEAPTDKAWKKALDSSKKKL